MLIANRNISALSRNFSRKLGLALVATLLLPAWAAAQFVDDFDRANSANVGNGWVEKTPAAFSIANGEAAKQAVSGGYRDMIVYRPAGENLLDVEASVEFQLTNAQPGYPQLFTRVQTDISAFTDFLDGYMIYIDDNASRAILGRQRGTGFVTTLSTITLNPALNTTDTYRMRLRSTGTSPVALTAFVERQNGANWDIIGQANVNDNNNDRINVAGSVGFGGYIEASYNYDNFTRTDLGGGSNPLPVLNSLNPDQADEGGAGFTLTVNGSDFVGASTVRWNGADRATTFISPTQLQATIGAADIATAGTATVTVFSPAPGGGSSGAQTFTIDPVVTNNPQPVINNIAPDNAEEGSAGFTLTVNGSDFIAASEVRWNGAARATTFVSTNQLQATITAADLANAGNAAVTVFTPAPGGGTSAARTFTIDPATGNNPVPVLNTLNPERGLEDSGSFTLTLTGINFIADSVVRWNGADRATTFVSANQLQATITAADMSNAGTADVTVFNPLPGGGTSAVSTFTIDPSGAGNSPLPVMGSIAPDSVEEGSGGFTLTVQGADFVPASVVRWNGATRTTTYVNGSELQATITAADVAVAGSANVTVFSPAPGGGESGVAAFTISVAGNGFLDDFNRPNNAALGNGWIEKTPAAFTLAGGQAAKQVVSAGYRDLVVYRPASENLLDVEASVEFQLSNAQPGYPQLFTRLQTDVSAFADFLEGYMLYVDDSASRVILGRQTGTAFVNTLATINLSPALNTTDTFRLRMRSTGTSTVALTAFVERQNGANWDVIGQASYNDNAANRINLAGSVGFGGYVEASYNYDNFERTDLGSGSNPLPTATTLTPNSATEGDPGLTLTIDGSNFIAGSQVRWNGADRTTTFLSSTQLQAAIPASDFATAGNNTVTVNNPAPGGGTSAALTFTVDTPAGNNPLPVLNSLAPNSAPEGSPGFTLTLNGSGFVAASQVRWNGVDRATTFVSATELQATIPAGDLAAAGTATVDVVSPAPGGGTSASRTFTIDPPAANPQPVLNAITPDRATEGSGGFTLTLNGNNFIAGSQVRWNGANRATTFITATQIQATIPASDIANAGTANVTVFNPAPGGGTSLARTFTIDPAGGGADRPSMLSVSPQAVNAGAGSQTLTVIGNGFTAQSVGNWNGTTRNTTFVSSQELQVDVPAADLADASVATLTVFTPAPGGGTSDPYPFFVLEPGSTYFFDDFNAPDNGAIGNDWTEKNPAAFSLQNNEVVGIDTSTGYRDNIVYRPQVEDARDVELSIEFVRQDDLGFAQLHARATRDTVAVPDTLASYIMYMEDFIASPGAVAIAVGPPDTGFGECILSLEPLPQAMVVGERYRMTFRVTGGYPVDLEAIVERFDGTGWQSYFSSSITHDNSTPADPYYCYPPTVPAPIQNEGAMGFAKWVDAPEDYDNFYWMDLTGIADLPVIQAVSPESAEVGGGDFTLLVTGSGYTPTSVVRWDGADRPTTFVSSTTLQAAITAADISTIRPVPVTVFTPSPGGGLSNAATFQVVAVGQQPNPAPTLADMQPATVVAGSGNTVLTVNGSGFVDSSEVRFNGAALPTTYLSPTSLSVTLTAAQISAVGSAAISVSSPAPGGGQSGTLSLAIVDVDETFDDFQRADAANIGAGWTEKSPQSFQISANAALKLGANVGYRDNVVYRPAGEAVLNTESSVEFQLSNAQPGYPQLFNRLQSATVQTPDSLDGYMLYIDGNPGRAQLGIQSGFQFVTSLATINLTETLNTTSTYRLRMSTQNAGPSVNVAGYVERLTANGFVIIGQAAVTDNSGQAIQNAGVCGFGGFVEQSYSFDNYRCRDLDQ